MFKELFARCFRSNKPHVEVFVRHCHFSAISQHKVRYPGFTRKKAYENLLSTLNKECVNVTYFLDTFHPVSEPHFVKQQNRFPVVEIREGSETGSFLKLLEHVSQLKLDPETIVYFLEDDYFHQAGWIDVLLEGFSLPGIDYVTLYDHRDKYFHPNYQALQSKLYHTASCHWRTTPSTTNTYAMRFKTLLRDLEIHRAFSLGRTISADHEKFCKLTSLGSVLISPIPGWSTHAELEFASPCVNWDKLINNPSSP
jgi:hypothetical protein